MFPNGCMAALPVEDSGAEQWCDLIKTIRGTFSIGSSTNNETARLTIVS